LGLQSRTIRHPAALSVLALCSALLACGGGEETAGPSGIEITLQTEAAPTPTRQPTPDPTPGTVVVEKLPPVGEQATPTASKKKRWLGISVANMVDPIPGAPEQARAMIQRAFRGGPAHLAGLQRGDVIVEASGKPVKKYQDYLAEARNVEIGATIDLKIARQGETIPVTLEMIEKPADMKRWRRKAFPGTPGFEWDLATVRPPDARIGSAGANGRPQVLYFWASWCGPCNKTGPMVEALHTEVGDRVVIAAISSEDLEVVQKFTEKNTATYTIAHDAVGTAKLDFEVKSLPTIVLIDGGGTVAAWDYGVGGVRHVLDEARTMVTPR